MKKLITILAVSLFVLFFAVSVTGFYPIAMADGTLIWQRTWQYAQDAVMRSVNAQNASLGKKPIDFFSSENAGFLAEIRRGTLTALIEDAVLVKEGDALMQGFSAASREKVTRALSRAPGAGEGARILYGLDENAFLSLVLYPQARRETLYEYLTLSGKDFDAWIRDAKKSARIRLFFTPFQWREGEVR